MEIECVLAVVDDHWWKWAVKIKTSQLKLFALFTYIGVQQTALCGTEWSFNDFTLSLSSNVHELMWRWLLRWSRLIKQAASVAPKRLSHIIEQWNDLFFFKWLEQIWKWEEKLGYELKSVWERNKDGKSCRRLSNLLYHFYFLARRWSFVS